MQGCDDYKGVDLVLHLKPIRARASMITKIITRMITKMITKMITTTTMMITEEVFV